MRGRSLVRRFRGSDIATLRVALPERTGRARVSSKSVSPSDRLAAEVENCEILSSACRPTQQRDYSADLAKQQPDRALQVARGIEDPWFRCQALSHVARYLVSEAERNDVLTEAFLAGSKLSEPNRVATVSAWPLKVLALTSQSTRLEAE